MTPVELRVRGWSFLEAAGALLKQGQFDNAAYNCGYAVELALKARYCTRRQWDDFPNDRVGAKLRGAPDKLLSHDLAELLKLSDATFVHQHAFHQIRWDLARDWWSEQRYTPIRTVTEAQAKAQLEESEKLFLELVHYEIIEVLLPFEIEMSKQRGPFNLFALVFNFDGQPCSVLTSSWWQAKANDIKGEMEHLSDRCRRLLAPDLYATIKRFAYLPPLDPWVQRFYALARGIEHSPRTIATHNVVHGRFLPSGYIITCVPRPEPKAGHDSPTIPPPQS